jgi:hypothetical protein
MGHYHPRWIWAAGIVVVATAFAGVDAQPSGTAPLAQRTPAEPAPADGRLTYTTPNTTRIAGPNVYAAAAAITQVTYAATHHEDRPHAVTLVRADRQADAMLAAARVTHFPVNSPVLYVDEDRLPAETHAELARLGPDGNTYDEKVQVYVIGPISDRVVREVRERLGYKTRVFPESDPLLLSEKLDTWAAAVHADHPDAVAIVQYDRLDTGLPVVAWSAHMGHALLFVEGDTIPAPTRRALGRRYRGEAFMYLLGDSSVISDRVASALAAYGHVQRVPGGDAYQIGVSLAGYRDAGLDEGYWFGSSTRDFGWGVAEAGHNFTFANPDDWPSAVAGSVLSHLGKHGPMLLVRQGGLPEDVVRYLEMVRPSSGAPGAELFNHGWILGDTQRIGWPVQAHVDALLEPR